MKKHLRAIAALFLAIVFVMGIAYVSTDARLKASEDDGSTTASEQQHEAKEEKKTVVVDVPKKEESKAEPAKEEPAKEAPKAEPAKEEPKNESEKREAVKEEEPETSAPAAIEESTQETKKAAKPKAVIQLENKGKLTIGDKVKLRAEISGIEVSYKIQWQYRDDKKWVDIKGATGTTYSFKLDEENSDYDYRVVIDY